MTKLVPDRVPLLTIQTRQKLTTVQSIIVFIRIISADSSLTKLLPKSSHFEDGLKHTKANDLQGQFIPLHIFTIFDNILQ